MARQMVKRTALAILSLIAIVTCRAQDYEWQTVKMDSTIIADPDMERYIAIYRDSMDVLMSDVIGVSRETMTHERPESPLSRLLADIAYNVGCEWAANNNAPMPQLALINNGGIRANLRKGNISKRNIYEIAPFENTLAIIVIDGNVTKQMFDHIALRGGEALSNAQMTISEYKASEVMIAGEPLDTTRSYVLVTLDFLANGGDNFKMLETVQHINTGVIFRDAIISTMLKNDNKKRRISAPTDRRITTIDSNEK